MGVDEQQLVAALCTSDPYPHSVRSVELIETHISWVFLTGDFAYKVKKPVRFPFLDFTTLALRKRFCQDELHLNRRLAPEIYLDVVPIGGSPAAPRIGAEPAFEYAVRMVQFPRQATLDEALREGHVPVAGFTAFAERLAEFHREQSSCQRQTAKDPVADNFTQLAESAGQEFRDRLQPIGDWLSARTAGLADFLLRREAEGSRKDCHGDLHLGNVVWLEGRIVPFDCLEFDADLRCIDTVDEAAFFAMDLMAHRRHDLAYEFLNRYFENSGDYPGARLLRYFFVHRALVRAKVRQLSSPGGPLKDPTPYVDLAAELCAERQPVLLLTHGLSGSGKTTATTGLIGRMPAIRIRSDVERKRLHGLGAGERSGSGLSQGIYSASASAATYRHLAEAAESVLAAGIDVIVDAACLRRSQREIFASLAERCRARFVVLSFSADTDELRRRISQRSRAGRDVSEADLEVLDYQIEHHDAIAADESGAHIEIDTSGPVGADELLRKVQGELRKFQ